MNKLKFRLNLYELRENRKVKPHTFKAMVEGMLYERRSASSATKIVEFLSTNFENNRFGPYFVAPVIAGLEPDTNDPFVIAMDLLGAGETNEPFAVAGTAEESLLGLCEALWEPNLVRTYNEQLLWKFVWPTLYFLIYVNWLVTCRNRTTFSKPFHKLSSALLILTVWLALAQRFMLCTFFGFVSIVYACLF